MSQVVTWEARKKFLGDVLFLSTYWNKYTHPHPSVVYYDNDPITHQNLLKQWFPNMTFVYNPQEIVEDAIFLIIRDKTLDQEKVLTETNPLEALLIFIPKENNFKGTVYWQPWDEPDSTETLLVPLKDENEYEYIEWNVQEYLQTCFIHNDIRKTQTFGNPYAYQQELVKDYDSCAEGKILEVYVENILEDSTTKVQDLSISITKALVDGSHFNLESIRKNKGKPFMERLADVLLHRNFALIKEYLISDEFVIDNNVYRWKVNCFFYRERLHNDSGLLMRAAVGSGCYGIVKILLLEESIDPEAMDNIALQDAILSNKKDIIALLASSKMINCPKVYNINPTPWSAYEVYRSGVDLFKSSILHKYDATSRQLVTDPIFIEYYKNGIEKENVRNTPFHQALLATYQDTKNESYLKMLCESTTMKERQSRPLWEKD